MAGRRRALIVANGEYDNAGLQRLGSPAADADALAGVLGDRAISDFEVCVVRNETAHVVQAEIEDLCLEGKPDDVLLMHFSCHGLKDDSGGLYFAARNTRPDRLRSTAVPAQFVQQCLRQRRSRRAPLPALPAPFYCSSGAVRAAVPPSSLLRQRRTSARVRPRPGLTPRRS